MKLLNLEVITPSKKAYSGNVQSVTVPGTLGSFQILYNHAPILSTLEAGEIKIVDSESNELHFAVGGGTVEVLKNKILILAESFENPAEIDIKRAEEAMQRAKERLKSRNSQIDDLRAEVALKRAINRLSIRKKYF